jgi:hypothetical protein
MTRIYLALLVWVTMAGGTATGLLIGSRHALPASVAAVAKAEQSSMPRGEKAETRAGEAKATNKERFDLCIAMLKSYYDAIEARFSGTMAFMVIVIGWLVTSESTRNALRANSWLRHATVGALSLLMLLYAWNIDHWLNRWREIRGYTESLNYIEPPFYSRYHSIPSLTWYTYMVPVIALYAVVLLCVWMITHDRFAAALSTQTSLSEAGAASQKE